MNRQVVKLRQPDICGINTDMKIFQFLRVEYQITRKRWWSWISLWALQSIRFARFELHEDDLVDTKKLDEVPPPTKSCEYLHGLPNPPEHVPPLGPNLLMHMLKHHEKLKNRTRKCCLKKMPRKLTNRLTLINDDDDTVGWGLQFIEGWSWKRLVYSAAILFCLTALLVMILASVIDHNIQTAGAIAGCILSIFTAGIAIMQAALYMS
jgi:hypothetical protein